MNDNNLLQNALVSFVWAGVRQTLFWRETKVKEKIWTKDDDRRAYAKMYYQKHKEEIKARSQAYRDADPEQYRERHKEYMREYRIENADELKDYYKEYMRKYRKRKKGETP